ncbi:MAG: signal peptidase I [Caldilineales bacterium]|nr:signal peptidase I [Caldilineales bacterium]
MSTRLKSILAVSVLIAVWFLFMPYQIGGRANYLVIDGVSMEPNLHTGDLVILRLTDKYRIGDIAAYYLPDAKGVIIHRVVAEQNGRFILLGDNKDKVDAYYPSLEDMVGKYWLRIPRFGEYIYQIKSLALQFGMVAFAFLVMPPLLRSQYRSKRKQPRSDAKNQPMHVTTLLRADRGLRADLFFYLVALILVFSVLAFFGFRQPLTHPATDNVEYEQTGTFSYSASAPPGIYNSEQVQTGEPIFLQLISRVNIRFDYNFTSDAPNEVAGVYRLLAVISHANGWARTIEILPESPFNGNSFTVSSDIDLSAIQDVLNSVEQQTGLLDQRYTVTTIPEVTIYGIVDGLPFQDEFKPQLKFSLDSSEMRIAEQSANRTDTRSDSVFAPRATGSVQVPTTTPNVMSLFGLEVSVLNLRRIALTGLVVSVITLLFLAWLALRRPGDEDEAKAIQARYGALLVNIAEPGPEAMYDAIAVAGIDDLARLAERGDSMILYYVNGGRHHYLVNDRSAVYYYETGARPDVHRESGGEEAT